MGSGRHAGVWRGGGAIFVDYLRFLDGEAAVDLVDLCQRLAALQPGTARARLCITEMSAQLAIAVSKSGAQLSGQARAISSLALPWSYRMPSLCRVLDQYLAAEDQTVQRLLL